MAGQQRQPTITVDSDGFARQLQSRMREVRIDGMKGLQRVGLAIQNRAREMCPVDTGRLRASIQMVVGDDHVVIGSNVAYAGFVEYGTSRAPAQPYLRPAVAEEVAARSGRPW